MSGIDIALWDIKGQALGVPVYELLGGRCRDRVECFFQPGYLTSVVEHPQAKGVAEGNLSIDEGEIRATAERFISEGFRYIRISPNAVNGVFRPAEAMTLALRQLRAVREAVGDRLELMVDLHTRLSPPEAVWFCRECEPLRMAVVEDPIRSEHAEGYRHIRRHTNVPLAAGEQWATKWEFRTAIEEELVDYVRTDLCIAGGISEGRKIAAMAETHLIKLLLHNPLGPVCTAASLHLDLACDNAGPQEVLWPPQEMLPDVFECAFHHEGRVPDRARRAGHRRALQQRGGQGSSGGNDRTAALASRGRIVHELLSTTEKLTQALKAHARSRQSWQARKKHSRFWSSGPAC